MDNYDNFDWVFSYEHLYRSYQQCRKGVSWKASVQRYNAIAPLKVRQTLDKLRKGTYKSKGFYEFDINERGKKRHIRSVNIEERVVQRCLCDYSLTPMLGKRLIYDNGASSKGKGYSFAIDRLEKQLKHEINVNGRNNYILLYDFHKYFDSIDHDYAKSILKRYYTDERLLKLMFHFIDNFGDIGLGLGSQISQILALIVPNKIDHYFKEQLHIKGYGRYMDDGYAIGTKEELKNALDKLKRLCKECGNLQLNEKKTHIVKLTHNFVWLKVKFIITDSGKIIKVLNHDSIVRERRKLKSFKNKYDTGEISLKDIYSSFQSWVGHTKEFNSYNSVNRMKELYNELFGKEVQNNVL